MTAQIGHSTRCHVAAVAVCIAAIRCMCEFSGCSSEHSAGLSRGAGQLTLRSQVAQLTLFFSIPFSVLKEFFVG
jgi:hypothetical protein